MPTRPSATCLAAIVLPVLLQSPGLIAAEPRSLTPRLHHLRSGAEREWSDFPESAESTRLELTFPAAANEAEWTLTLRQQDVRRNWSVRLNDRKLADLVVDENDQLLHLSVPPGSLIEGENRLAIECTARAAEPSDDIRIGEIVLREQAPAAVLQECRLQVRVRDADRGRSLPSRITITTPGGALQPVGVESSLRTAVRTGCVYTVDGAVELGLPAGRYVVHAGRGFEYSLARAEVDLAAGDVKSIELAIRRVVPTEGYVACDTHVHSRTHSGHGDATVEERMATLAGEGIELPIAADHNVQIDHTPYASAAGVREWFTPVIGNEVTTKVGHFNAFPMLPRASPPDHTLERWEEIFNSIAVTPGVRVILLNHARDIHNGVRPFGPKLHNAVVGENLQGWPMRFNAMEVINSGATQSEPLQLLHDWMGLVNRGLRVTPIGSSDSHDVNRYIVGQGRTYIRVDDRRPGRIDVDAAMRSLLDGRVLVSYGLLAEMHVVGDFQSGEIAPLPEEGPLHVKLRVLGPEWARPRTLLLYANGEVIREEAMPDRPAADLPAGVHWEGEWELPRPTHDLFLAAVVVGEGVDQAFWRTAKPYQPTSPHFTPHTLGCSGAVYVDADRDGGWTSARGYAERLTAESDGDLPRLLKLLAGYDSAVAAHAAHLYRVQGGDLESAAGLIAAAAPATRRGIDRYLTAWRENQIAQLQ